ncbi:MAG: hypothetical protein ACHQZS_03740 [Candidatus Binatales bacterium]
MIANRSIIREAAAVMAAAAEAAIEDYRRGLAPQETSITDRMIANMQRAILDFDKDGIRWSGTTVHSRTQERRLGADLVGALDIAVDGYSVQKGFLAQAKILEMGAAIRDLAALRRQCRNMINTSAASFVFLYSRSGVTIVPAISVAGSSDPHIYNLHWRGLRRFYEEHFASFIGDPGLGISGRAAIDELIRKTTARVAFLVSARG